MASNKNKKHPLRGVRKVIFCIIKLFLRPYVRIVQNVRMKKNGFRLPKGPCFFMSNHQNNWDGIYVNLMFYSRCIYFLMHDELFRYKISKFFFQNLLGMVPRTNSKSNLSAINTLVELRNDGENIGLYPEGDIDFWGKSIPINNSSAKLAKLLKYPVVLLNVSGGHLRAPRWATYANRSRITYQIVDVISAEDVKSSSINDLHIRIQNAIRHDDPAMQRKKRIRLLGPSHANRLENGLFVCPECGSFSTLKSQGSSFSCTKCGMSVKLNHYDMFENYQNVSEKTPKFQQPTDWNDWQMGVLKTRLSQELDLDTPIYTEANAYRTTANIDTGFKGAEKRPGVLTLYPNRITYARDGEDLICYPLSEVNTVTLQFRTVLEFYHDDKKYRFKTKKPSFSAYMWVQSINLLKSK